LIHHFLTGLSSTNDLEDFIENDIDI